MLKWLSTLLSDLTKDWVRAGVLFLVTMIAAPTAARLAYPEFFQRPHQIAGWVILVAIAGCALLAASIALNFGQWLRQRQESRRTLSVVAEYTYGNELTWRMAKVRQRETMIPCGNFLVTNLASTDVAIPSSILVARYWVAGVLPWSRTVIGHGMRDILPRDHLERMQFTWTIEPPLLKPGQTMRARVGLVDNLGRINWSDWHDWWGHPGA